MAKMDVPFFRYPYVFQESREEVLATMVDTLERGAFILQEDTRDFERELAEYVGVGHAVGTANATDALFLALVAAGIEPGDGVVVPSHTFVASVAAIRWAGGTPILADCAPADHLLDVASVRQAWRPGARFIMPVQLNGRVANMEEILEFADAHNAVVIEDSAQALGARYRGRGAGSLGKAGVFSFYPAKALGCFGDGGALVTDDGDLANEVRLRRDHGRPAHGGDVLTWGVNSRLDNLQAAVLRVKLRGYDEEIARRREIAAVYDTRLSPIYDLTLPPGPNSGGDHFDVFQNYELAAGRRDELREHLRNNGVATIVQWGGKPVHQFDALQLDGDLPETDRFFRQCFLLPMNTSLTDAEIHYVCDTILSFY